MLHSAAFEHDVQLFYLAGNVVILQRCSLEVGESVIVPVIDNALLNELIEAGYMVAVPFFCRCLACHVVSHIFSILFFRVFVLVAWESKPVLYRDIA